MAPEIRERCWVPGQTLVDQLDGSVVLTFEVAGLNEVERWVMSFGAGARVLGPVDLVEKVRAHVAGMVVGYGRGGVGKKTPANAVEERPAK